MHGQFRTCSKNVSQMAARERNQDTMRGLEQAKESNESLLHLQALDQILEGVVS